MHVHENYGKFVCSAAAGSHAAAVAAGGTQTTVYFLDLQDDQEDNNGGSRKLAGPFETVREAESAGENIPLPWLKRYADNPLYGSMFSIGMVGRKEHDSLERSAAGRVWCYAPIGNVIAQLFANSRSMIQIPDNWHGCKNAQDAEDLCETMNLIYVGLSHEMSVRIVASIFSDPVGENTVTIVKSESIDRGVVGGTITVILATFGDSVFNYATWTQSNENQFRRDFRLFKDFESADHDFVRRAKEL